ncbi:MAG: uL22 family ribosomal protein [Thermoanaerobaculia bacterium]
MESVARLRHYRGSAQKVRLVADLIRMKPVGRALATLAATPKGCSSDLKKLVESAVANAQQNGSGVDADALVVSRILVDGAGRKPLQRNAMLRSVSNYKKRFARPRFMSGPQGRMWLVTRPFCHVTVFLSDDPAVRRKAGLSAEPARPVARKKGGKVAAAVAKAAARPQAPKAAPKGEGKPKAPRAKKGAPAAEPGAGQE